MLNKTDIKILVMNGQLDGEVPAFAAEAWINELNWTRRDELARKKKTVFAYEYDGVTPQSSQNYMII